MRHRFAVFALLLVIASAAAADCAYRVDFIRPTTNAVVYVGEAVNVTISPVRTVGSGAAASGEATIQVQQKLNGTVVTVTCTQSGRSCSFLPGNISEFNMSATPPSGQACESYTSTQSVYAIQRATARSVPELPLELLPIILLSALFILRKR